MRILLEKLQELHDDMMRYESIFRMSGYTKAAEKTAEWRKVLLTIIRQKGQIGQSLTEYGMLIVLVGVIVMVILFLLGDVVANIYQNIVEALPF